MKGKMTRMRAQVIAVAILAAITAPCVLANELNDSIQAFHRGDYAAAQQGLGQLIASGQRDARAFYYRGLIHLRQRNPQAAAEDFEMAMQLETQGQGPGVSVALERVQGHERLVIEKYRAMARLAARNRQQLPAPRPVVFAEPTPENHDPAVTRTSGSPIYRLASEIPVSRFLLPAESTPTKDLAEQRPDQPAGNIPPTVAVDEPVGTGLVDSDDPFAEFAEPGGEFSTPAEGSPSRAQKVIRGVFRALFRANVPQVPLQGVMPGMPGGPPAGFGDDDVPGFEDPGFGGDGGFRDDSGFGDDAGNGDGDFDFGNESSDDDPFGF